MTKQTISAQAKEAGMTAQTLRRTVAVVERCQRQAEILQHMAEAVTKEIRKRRKGLSGAVPSQWLEDRDGLREDAQLLRIDARETERLLRLVLRGRFIAAKQMLNGESCDPCGCVSKILGPTVDRGFRKFHSDYRPGNSFLRVKRG